MPVAPVRRQRRAFHAFSGETVRTYQGAASASFHDAIGDRRCHAKERARA